MKTLIQLLLMTFTILACVCCRTAKGEKTDGKLNGIIFVDPTVFIENGKYYLIGTCNRKPSGFTIFESTDLKEWKTANGDTPQLILRKGDSAHGEGGFWAPQLFKEGNRYYLTHTANEHTAPVSSNPVYGPFRQGFIRPIDETAKNIDSFSFKDSDRKHYLHHVRFNRGNYLWVAEFDLQKGCVKPETLKKCFDDTEAWERMPNYKSTPVMEGPTVVKLDDSYYLFYSVNHFKNIDYAMGYTTSTSPYGSWKKHADNPTIHRSIAHENGSGRGDLFKGLDGRYYYVYRAHHLDSVVQSRKTRIVPLILKKEDNVYSITIDKENVVKPM